jgi:hypothetical protein
VFPGIGGNAGSNFGYFPGIGRYAGSNFDRFLGIGRYTGSNILILHSDNQIFK